MKSESISMSCLRVHPSFCSLPGLFGPPMSALVPPLRYRDGWPRLPLLALVDIGTQGKCEWAPPSTLRAPDRQIKRRDHPVVRSVLLPSRLLVP
jgi:hypothetical protein